MSETGIRIGNICRAFAEDRTISDFIPSLTNKINTLCKFAANGDPEILSNKELAKLASSLPDAFKDVGGAEKFAKLVAKGNFVKRNYKDSDPSVNDLYNGFKGVTVSEPPFLYSGHLVDKIGENLRTGSQMILIDDVLPFELYPDKIIFSGETYLSIPRSEIEKALKTITHRDISLPLNYLPFMPGYKDSHKSPAFAITKGETSERYPLGMDKNGQKTFIDGYGRIAYDKNLDYYEQFVTFGVSREERSYSSGSWCFTGKMFLMTEKGDKIRFEDLYKMYEKGLPLPKVMVKDPNNVSKWGYQRPTAVLKHLGADSHDAMVLITLRDINGSVISQPMEVTKNHFMWIKRNGRELWAQAVDIKEGDELLLKSDTGRSWRKVYSNVTVSSDEEIATAVKDGLLALKPKFSFKEIAKRPSAAAIDVYNLSFEDGAKAFHNYAISADGNTWMVGHNSIK